MNTTVPGRSPDRLIWLPLLAVMTVALVAGQARANLHAEARAAAALPAALEASVGAEAWCRMHRYLLAGDEEAGVGELLKPSPAFGPTLPGAPPEARRSRSVHASR